MLASAFWLIPTLGLTRTAAICVALNLGCAALALFALRGDADVVPKAVARPGQRAMLIRLALTGLLGIGYEVLVVRVLSRRSLEAELARSGWVGPLVRGLAERFHELSTDRLKRRV